MIYEDEQRTIYLMFNANAAAVDFVLPPAPSKGYWHLVVDTHRETPEDLFAEGEEPLLDSQQTYHVGPRSSAILVARSQGLASDEISHERT